MRLECGLVCTVSWTDCRPVCMRLSSQCAFVRAATDKSVWSSAFRSSVSAASRSLFRLGIVLTSLNIWLGGFSNSNLTTNPPIQYVLSVATTDPATFFFLSFFSLTLGTFLEDESDLWPTHQVSLSGTLSPWRKDVVTDALNFPLPPPPPPPPFSSQWLR